MDVDPIDDGPSTIEAPPVPVYGSSSSGSGSGMMMMMLMGNDDAVDGGGSGSGSNSNNIISTEEDAKRCLDLLRSEEMSYRVQAAHRLDAVARLLGPERTRSVSDSERTVLYDIAVCICLSFDSTVGMLCACFLCC